ncbi:hypothetical protein KKZ20_10545 [Clostridioides difficile]|nr:hypothetical protein [Clostridioides difficile]
MEICIKINYNDYIDIYEGITLWDYSKEGKRKGICIICGNEGNALKTVDNEFLCDECFEKCRGEIAVLGKGLKN